MKTLERTNPIPGKTDDPNYEPWLTVRELTFELEALQNGIRKMMGGLLNGK